MFTIKEEIANAITHGIGVLLSIPALVFLIIFAANYGSAWDIVSFTIFGVSMLLLYLSSTLLHSITHKKRRTFWRLLIIARFTYSSPEPTRLFCLGR